MMRIAFCLVPRRGLSTSTFRASDLIIKRNERGRVKPDPEKLVFGAEFSDHMLTIKHTNANGWEKPVIEPLRELSIHPAAKVLHYSTEVNRVRESSSLSEKFF